MATKTIHSVDQLQLFAAAARCFFDAVRGASDARVVVALPGGRSVVGLLRGLLANAAELSTVDWQRIEWFIVDERLVPLDHADSNYRLLDEIFFTPAVEQGLVQRAAVHPFVPELSAPDFGLAAYEQELENCGGKFSIVVLGVGEDAHVAALFPRHHSLANSAPGFISMPDSPKPPSARMSAARALIQSADTGFALFVGEGKREALRSYLDAEVSIQDCPAKILDSLAVGYVVTDLPINH